jgi:uncharacterized protein
MIISRYLRKILQEYLLAGKVNLIFGTRRVGKTFLLQHFTEQNAYKTLWLEGEDLPTQRLLAERSTATYQALIADHELLIIDEAQEIPEIGKVLKLIIDSQPHLRVLVTGSSAFDLANLSGEPLTGRAFFHQLFPIAQLELANHYNLLQIHQQLPERLVYGSYPALFSLETLAQKERYLRELLTTYLLKDVLAYEGIRNASKIKDLLRLVAFQVGKEVSLDELGKQLQLNKATVEKYLDLCSKVFLLVKVGGFSRNLRKEVTKTARWYFWDNGIRNALIGDFRPLSSRTDVGELWENFLISERLKAHQAQQRWVETYFWRTYDQQEIDWVEVENQEIRAYEMKWTLPSRIKAPKAFAEAYPEASFEVIHQQNFWEFVGS